MTRRVGGPGQGHRASFKHFSGRRAIELFILKRMKEEIEFLNELRLIEYEETYGKKNKMVTKNP